MSEHGFDSNEGNNFRFPQLPNLNLPIDRRTAGKIAAGLGAAGVIGAISEYLISRYNKEKRLSTEVPDFVLAGNGSEKEKYIPENIIEIIDQARDALENKEAGFTIQKVPINKLHGKRRKAQERNLGYRTTLAGTNTVLATLNLEGADYTEIHTVLIDQNGQPEEEGHEIVIGKNLGVGTQIDITAPANEVVLAVRKAIPNRGNPKEVIYTPYSPDLNTAPVRLEGFKYLTNLLVEANTELKKAGVTSKASKEPGISTLIDPRLSLKLALIEQVDPGDFLILSRQYQRKYNITQQEADINAMKILANRALTTMGANREIARKYAVSDQGASGLFQLMPGTYNGIKDLYPKAHIDSDFYKGATEHTTAAKVSLLLNDSNLAIAPHEFGYREKLKDDPVEMGAYLVACYNAGGTTISKLIRRHGLKWQDYLPKRGVNGSTKEETRDYIRKFLALQNLFEGGIQRQPKLPEKDPSPPIPKQNYRHMTPRRSHDIPDVLQGSAASMARQHAHAREDGLKLIPDMKSLQELVHAGKLVPLPENKWLKIDPRLPHERRYCTPAAAKMLLDLANDSLGFDQNFEPIVINSAVRPLDVQKKLRRGNQNASKNSAHPYGSVVDLKYTHMSQKQFERVEAKLVEMEQLGLIEATEELGQHCFHIMVFNRYKK